MDSNRLTQILQQMIQIAPVARIIKPIMAQNMEKTMTRHTPDIRQNSPLQCAVLSKKDNSSNLIVKEQNAWKKYQKLLQIQIQIQIIYFLQFHAIQ